MTNSITYHVFCEQRKDVVRCRAGPSTGCLQLHVARFPIPHVSASVKYQALDRVEMTRILARRISEGLALIHSRSKATFEKGWWGSAHGLLWALSERRKDSCLVHSQRYGNGKLPHVLLTSPRGTDRGIMQARIESPLTC